MADLTEQLKQLQTVDGELHRLRRQLAQQPAELAQVQARVAAQEAKLKQAEDRMKSLQVSQKEKEVELQTREANVRKLQSQLFQLKTNKEYSAMQREIESIKADNSVLEEAILGAFDQIEQAVKARAQEQEALKGVQQKAAGERAEIEKRTAAVQEQIAQLERARQGLLPDVPKEALNVYERVLAIREGLALVPVVNDACGGCHRRLTPQVINQVYMKTVLVTCESCNRILYFDEAHSKL
jgi:hypothetical protein